MHLLVFGLIIDVECLVKAKNGALSASSQPERLSGFQGGCKVPGKESIDRYS